MNTPKHKWFTLVELIVVITILAILWTIAFISLQWFNADARDSKRTIDISNVSKTAGILSAQGVDVKAFVDGTGSTITWTGTGANTSTGARIRISWAEWYTALSGSYAGGDINYIALGIKKENFSDPLVVATAYKIGATNYNGQYYEIAATLENGGNPKAITTGSWNARLSTPFPGNINTGSDTFTLSGTTLASDTGLRVRDIIEFSNSLYTIIKINQNTIQVDAPCALGSSSILLHGDESAHIIKRWGPNANSDNFKIDPTNGLKGSPYPLN